MNATELTLLQNAARAWSNEDDPGLDAAMEEIEIFLLERRTQPAQDQVAAVRAVPEGMPVAQEPKYGIRENRLFNRASGEFIPLGEPVFIFRARDKLAAQALTDYRFHCVDEQHRAAIALRFIDFERFANDHPDRMKYPDTAAAPSPQPELSGSIDTPEFDFSNLWQYDSSGQPVPKGSFFLAAQVRNRFADYMSEIDAWKDAACAAAAEEARRDVHETNITCVNNMLKAQKRATDAEAKLAAIQQPQDEQTAFESWASDPVRAEKLPLDFWPMNGAYKDTRTYTAFYGWQARAALAQRTSTPSQSATGIPTDDQIIALGRKWHIDEKDVDLIAFGRALLNAAEPVSKSDTSGLPG